VTLFKYDHQNRTDFLIQYILRLKPNLIGSGEVYRLVTFSFYSFA